MKIRLKTHATFITLSLTILFFISNCQPRPQNNEAVGKSEFAKTEQAKTETPEYFSKRYFTGTIQPYEIAHIGAAQPARIERILVDIGDTVRQGQLLVVMDRTQLQQAQVQYQMLKTDLDRLGALHSAGAVSQQSFEQLKVQYEIAKANMKNLTQFTEIRATIPGVILGRYQSPGEIFSMVPGISGKPAIVSIIQIQPVKIVLTLPEKFFSQIKAGLNVKVTADLFPNREFMGVVDKIYPTIERATSTFRVQVKFENDELKLRPGMFARVAIDFGREE